MQVIAVSSIYFFAGLSTVRVAMEENLRGLHCGPIRWDIIITLIARLPNNVNCPCPQATSSDSGRFTAINPRRPGYTCSRLFSHKLGNYGACTHTCARVHVHTPTHTRICSMHAIHACTHVHSELDTSCSCDDPYLLLSTPVLHQPWSHVSS